MSFYDNKQAIWVFWKKPGCPLKHTDLLVYSYLGYRARYSDETSSMRKVSAATTLAPATVQEALRRLQAERYVDEAGRPLPQLGMFFAKGSTSDKWYDKMSFWKCLLPAGDSKLALVEVMVFSHLVHRNLTSHHGTPSYAHVGNALGLDARTVSAALGKLAEHNLFRFSPEGQWQTASVLTGIQLQWFRGKAGAEEKAQAGIGSFVPDEAEVLQNELAPQGRNDYTAPSSNEPLEKMLSYLDNELRGKVKDATRHDLISKLRGKGEVHAEKHWPEFSRYCLATLQNPAPDAVVGN